MLTFLHRCFLARGLGLSPTGLGLTVEDKKRLDTVLDDGVTWNALSRCMSLSERLTHREPHAKHIQVFEELVRLARRLLGRKMHHDVRNELDFALYIQELRALHAHDVDFPIEVVFVLTDSMSRLAPQLSVLWKEPTATELARKDLIIKAGLSYERHVYPNYEGCDELFYDGPWPQDDPVLSEARKRLALA